MSRLSRFEYHLSNRTKAVIVGGVSLKNFDMAGQYWYAFVKQNEINVWHLREPTLDTLNQIADLVS